MLVCTKSRHVGLYKDQHTHTNKVQKECFLIEHNITIKLLVSHYTRTTLM